jgi:hypothetical protein
VLVRGGDVTSASNYSSVQAQLLAVGRRVQVYADRRDAAKVKPDVLRDIVSTFDEKIFPTAARLWGPARDVDRDGRFTVLLTSRLAHLGDGRLAVDGYARAADLDANLTAPFSNRCDMMYLNAELGAGPHLRTILAHEYTHAVTASRKPPGIEEAAWLDEALAHLVEDLHHFSRSNLDYRVDAYLAAPERYQLVVEDYYAANLFRSHGNRGGTYLFLKFCVDLYGPELITALIRSPRRGVANLEWTTGASFPDLYRHWTTSLAVAGLRAEGASVVEEQKGKSSVAELELQTASLGSVDMDTAAAARLAAGPRATRVSPGDTDTWSAAGTSPHFIEIGPSPTGAVEVELVGPDEAKLQITAIRLPEDLPRLSLKAREVHSDKVGCLLQLHLSEEAGQEVHLATLRWEPLRPPAGPHSAGALSGSLNAAGVARLFGRPRLPGKGTLWSAPLAIRGTERGEGPLVFKVIGTDCHGRRVAGWAELDASIAPQRQALLMDSRHPGGRDGLIDRHQHAGPDEGDRNANSEADVSFHE